MRFTATPLGGAYVIDLEPHADPRGFFVRGFCAREFEAAGIPMNIVQTSFSKTRLAGTVRGMHYQAPPAQEAKLIRCIRGGVLDVIIDVRPESPTYLRHFSVELTPDNFRALYIPKGFAHGFQTLLDETEAVYCMDEFYTPACERGLRADDPALGIEWPLPITDRSEKDAAWPLLRAQTR